MVHSDRLRSRTRLAGKRTRLRPSRSAFPGTVRSSTIVHRYAKRNPLWLHVDVERQDEGRRRLTQLGWYRGVTERYVLKQLRQVAKVFPGAHVIQD